MNHKEIEEFVSRAKQRPLSTLFVVVAAGGILASGAWITSYFSEIGKNQAALQHENKSESSTPTEKQKNNDQDRNEDAKQKSEENTPISVILKEILDNQKNIQERLRNLEQKITSSSVDYSQVESEFSILNELLNQTVFFLSPDGRFSTRINEIAIETRKKHEEIQADSKEMKEFARILKIKENELLKLSQKAQEWRYEAISLTRELKESQQLIVFSRQMGNTKPLLKSVNEIYLSAEKLSISITNMLSTVAATINDEANYN